MLVPPGSWHPLLRKILDPPLSSLWECNISAMSVCLFTVNKFEQVYVGRHMVVWGPHLVGAGGPHVVGGLLSRG